jgi:hypothetical protein
MSSAVKDERRLRSSQGDRAMNAPLDVGAPVASMEACFLDLADTSTLLAAGDRSPGQRGDPIRPEEPRQAAKPNRRPALLVELVCGAKHASHRLRHPVTWPPTRNGSF